MAAMECLGPQCASMLLEWLKARAGTADGISAGPAGAGEPPGNALDGRALQRGGARRSARRPSSPARSSTCNTPSSGGTRTS